MKAKLRAARIQSQDTHGLSSSETLDRMDHTTNVSNALVATKATPSAIRALAAALSA